MDARLFVIALLLACPLAAEDKFPQQRRAFEEGMKRPPLGKRAGVIDRFARTRDPRALKLLLKRYAKPRLPKEHERYLLAAAIGKHFRDARFAAELQAALRRFDKSGDPWLWYHAARSRVAIAEPKNAFLAAARFGALAPEPRSGELALVAPLLGREGLADLKSMLFAEHSAALLLAHRTEIRTEGFRSAAEALLVRLHNDAPTSGRTRLVIARHFARLFDVQRVSLRAQYWRQLLSFQDIQQQEGATGEGRPRFFGVEATGDRIVFLIDLSDSMLEPLTPADLLDVKRLQQGTEAKGGAIDWSKIRTRFDLARLFLARYLRALAPDQRFMVVAFGDTARPLGATKNLVKASRGAVRSVIRELGKIKPTSRTDLHPLGQLRGATNIHGAFRLAFRATASRDLKSPTYVSVAGLERGCDTIFLLSDGKPTKDDFAANDRSSGGTVILNPETGEKGPGGGTASFRGPYVRTRYLLEDVARMNLFRKAEIHSVAMASADAKLMRGLADQGLGTYRPIGLRAAGGRVGRWWTVGPFPVPDAAKWSEAGEPEAMLKSGWSRPAVYRVKDTWIGWTEREGDRKHGVVALGSERDSCAYAYAVVVPDEAGDADLQVGARQGIRVWLNGELVLDALEPTEKFKRDAYKVAVQLKPGPNSLLVKVCAKKGALRFHARLSTPDGKPLSVRVD